MKLKLWKPLLTLSSISLTPVIALTAVSCSNNYVEDNKTRVIWIGVDGFSANAWKMHKTPNIAKLLTNSNYSMDAQDIMPSKTYPNWTALFTSMKPDKTGIMSNPGSVFDSKLIKKPTKYNNNGKGVAYSIFDAIKDQTDLKRTFVYPLIKDFNIKQILNKNAADMIFTGYEHKFSDPEFKKLEKSITTKISDGHSRAAYIYSEFSDGLSIQKAGDLLINKESDFIFSYITGLDIRGHAFGWGSNEYNKYMEKIDKYIGELIKKIKDQGDEDRTIFVLTADHGGVLNQKSHGMDTPNERTVPIIIHNKTLKLGNNMGRMSNLDVAPTLTNILKLKLYKDWDGNILKLK